MDIETKEKFLEEYDQLAEKIMTVSSRHPITFISSDYRTLHYRIKNWCDYLMRSDIDIVVFVIGGLVCYDSYEEFCNACKSSSNCFQPVKLDKNIHKTIELLGKFQYHPNLWESFSLILEARSKVQNEGEYTLNSKDKNFLEIFDDVMVFLRDIFEECLVVTDDDDLNFERINEDNIPASDRIVNINHNDPKHQEIMEKLEKLEANIKQSNSIDDEEKDRLRAELKASEGILKGKIAYNKVITTVLFPVLTYIVMQFVDTALAQLAAHLLTLLRQFIGF